MDRKSATYNTGYVANRLKLFVTMSLILFSTLVFSQTEKHLVVLHVNDTHSRVEPLPANSSRNANRGGAARQDAYFESVRKDNPNVLVFHCGDFVQGTPYFNLFKGEVEVRLLNLMAINAACLGNHEFDYGFPVLKKMLKQAKFPVISTNYDFSETPLKGLTKEYIIIKRDGVKIGILGAGVNPEGLIAKQNYAGMKYLPPVETLNRVAQFLKEKKKCDLIICLSHLGYMPDITLAEKSRNIDIILGGHTHTFLQKPDERHNLDGKEVVISQMGKDGIYVGRMDITMKEKAKGE